MPIAYVRGAGLICCHKKTIPYSILSILYIGFLSSRFDGFLWCHLPKFHTSDAQVSHKNFSCFFLQRYTFYSKIAINMGIIFTAGQRLPNGNTRRDTEPFRPCYLRKKPLKWASYQIFLSCKYPYNYLIVQTFCKKKSAPCYQDAEPQNIHQLPNLSASACARCCGACRSIGTHQCLPWMPPGFRPSRLRSPE